jgi:hypothetical protein
VNAVENGVDLIFGHGGSLASRRQKAKICFPVTLNRTICPLRLYFRSRGGNGSCPGGTDFDRSKAVLVTPPKKKAISIRVDEDLLDYFKRDGSGYQRRINQVLRAYVEQKRKAG